MSQPLLSRLTRTDAPVTQADVKAALAAGEDPIIVAALAGARQRKENRP